METILLDDRGETTNDQTIVNNNNRSSSPCSSSIIGGENEHNNEIDVIDLFSDDEDLNISIISGLNITIAPEKCQKTGNNGTKTTEQARSIQTIQVEHNYSLKNSNIRMHQSAFPTSGATPPVSKKRKIESKSCASSPNFSSSNVQDNAFLPQSQSGRSRNHNSFNRSNRTNPRTNRPIIGKRYLSLQTNQAMDAEKSRNIRVKEKWSFYYAHIHPNLPNANKRIVLDFCKETKKILVEVNSSFFSIIKEHQVDGIRFLYDCCIESIQQNFEKDEPGRTYGGILAHCMGLGKTLQVVMFVDSILTNKTTTKLIRTILIIVPINVIRNWEQEFQKWYELGDVQRNFHLFELYSIKGHKPRANMLKKWKELGGVMLITPGVFSEFFMRKNGNDLTEVNVCHHDFEFCLLDPGPDMVIIDEGHMLKNCSSRLNRVASRIKTLRRIILTGTPLQNNLTEYFYMVSFVKPNLLGTIEEFSNRFINPITNGQYIDSDEYQVRVMKKRYFILHKFLKDCIHRRDYNILRMSIPPKCEYVLNIRLSKAQEKMYQYYLDTFVFGNSVFKNNSPKRLLFLHFNILGFIWNHPALLIEYFDKCQKIINEEELLAINDLMDEDDESYMSTKPQLKCIRSVLGDWPFEFIDRKDMYRLEHGPKFQFLISILEECENFDDKLLVFSQRLSVLDLIERFLGAQTKIFSGTTVKRWKKNTDYFRIDGSANANQRMTIIEQINDVNNRTARLLLISTRAGGCGINLVGANRVIIFDSSWNPFSDIQAIYRIFRYGQTKPIFVYRFAASGTMESKIYKRQVMKESISLRVVDEFQIDRYYTKTDLHELYDLAKSKKILALNAPWKDKLLIKMWPTHEKYVCSYHEHDSLLENRPNEKLSEQERDEAWKNWENGIEEKDDHMENAESIPIAENANSPQVIVLEDNESSRDPNNLYENDLEDFPDVIFEDIRVNNEANNSQANYFQDEKQILINCKDEPNSSTNNDDIPLTTVTSQVPPISSGSQLSNMIPSTSNSNTSDKINDPDLIQIQMLIQKKLEHKQKEFVSLVENR